jgi:hypothetical protein
MLLAVTAFVVRESLKRVGAESIIISSARTSQADNIKVETALYKAIALMKDFSSLFGHVFSRENFYTNFSRSESAIYGANDTTISQVPSKLYINGSSNVPLLTNDPGTFGSESFPSTVNPANNTAMSFLGILGFADFGGVKVRITLIDAVPVDPVGDTLPSPTTDFKPIWRIDAMTGLTSGAHIYALMEGTPLRGSAPPTYWGIYGKEVVSLQGDNNNYALAACLSYNSATGAYSTSNRSDRCNVGTESATAGTNYFATGALFGTWQSNFINNTVNFGGRVCSSANFAGTCWTSGTRTPGTTTPCTAAGCWCMGASCVTPPSFASYYNGASLKTFASLCPTDQGSISDNRDSQTLATPGCWNTWTLNRNRPNRAFKIILTGSGDYYVNRINFGGRNTTTETSIAGHVYVRANPPAGGVVRLWVWNVTGPDANQKDITWFRTGSSDTSNATSGDGKPTSLKLNFMWSNAISSMFTSANIWRPNFTGGPEFKGFIYVPDGTFYISNNSSFTTIMNGGIYGRGVNVFQPMRYDVAGEAAGLSLSSASAGGGSGAPDWVSLSYTGAYDLLYTVRQQVQVFR